MMEKKGINNITAFKRAIMILIVISLIFGSSSFSANAQTDTSYILEADKLESLGLFKGTDLGYELGREPNRAEAGVMLVRLLGKESEALFENLDHPFSDVPEWASRYVGYLWQNGLTKGVGDGRFAPYERIDARSYLTFVLRSLGYSDDEGDFNWEQAVEYSYDLGLINGREYEELGEGVFTRGNMASISYNALNSRLKDSSKTLAAKLVEDGAIDADIAIWENFLFNMPEWEKYLRYLEAGYFKPYVVGKDLDTALIYLRKSGAGNIELEYSHNEIVPEGYIISQDYPAYMETDDDFDCVLEVSLGPTILYQVRLEEIAAEKEWDDEVVPYIISAAKYLIRETILTRYDVYRKLIQNVDDVILVDSEKSARMYAGAVYDAGSGDMYINRFILDEELILHELAHAMSHSLSSGKVGFPETGINTRSITEAYNHWLSGGIKDTQVGSINTFNTGTEVIEFHGGLYSEDGDNNFILGVFSPLFILAGRQQIESMYFHDVSTFSAEVLEFNSKYGEQRWENLWRLADIFITDPPFLSSEDRIMMAESYREYLDGIMECLYIDLQESAGSKNRLIIFENKLNEIQLSFPLGYSDYRQRFIELENTLYDMLAEYGEFRLRETENTWITPDLDGKSALEIYNILYVLGDAEAIGYEIVDSEMSEENIVGILYRSGDNPDEDYTEVGTGDRLDTGALYILQITGFTADTVGYVKMRNLVEDFGRYQADFDALGSFLVGRVLESEGFRFRYEFIYFDDVSPQMNGRIVGQFPEAGTAIIPGKTTITILIVRKRQ